ncbi:MAG: PorP/SprF family type IX secretion system membrane protein [Flavobacteriaceae bacterium]
MATPKVLVLKKGFKYLINFNFFIVSLSGLNLLAQDAHILFNRMNMAVYNPAFTGTNGAFISVNSRSQWVGIEHAPRTNYLIVNLPQKKKINLGFTAQNDRVFIENKTYLTVDYNYELQLSNNQHIFLGLKGGGFYNNISLDRLQRLYSTYNPALGVVESYLTPVLGFGIQYQGPNHFIGVGMPSIFNNKRFDDNSGWETTATDAAYLYFSGGIRFSLGKNLTLDPVLIYRSSPQIPNLFSGTVAVNYQDKLSLGAGYANNRNMALFFSSKNIDGVEFGYGYEFMNFDDNSAIQKGTHEFVLRFLLNNSSSKETDNQGEVGQD